MEKRVEGRVLGFRSSWRAGKTKMKLERTLALENKHSSELAEHTLGWAGGTCPRPGAEGRGCLSPALATSWAGWLCSAARPQEAGGRSGAGALGTPIQQVQRWGVWRGFSRGCI